MYEQRRTGYLVAVTGIIAVTGALKLFGEHVNSTTVALGLLLVVLFVATRWGSRPAVLAALLGVACFNFFYLPPVGKLTIDASNNWIALFAFLVTAVTAGQLWARAKQRAEEANAARRELERLYTELQDAFERASQAKALEQSERLKSALLDAVTHDLRTPLTAIKASITTLLEDLLSEANDDEEAMELDLEGRQEMMEVINEETDRLNSFIEGMMELARIEAGEMHLRKRWGAIEEIITRALERAAPLIREHQLNVQIEDGLPSVRVDDRSVAEVLFTLVDNAAKYSPSGTTINVSAQSTMNRTVQLCVDDEGAGIPAALRERVFDKFFRAMRDGDSGTHQPAGTGMGLAIAKGIVEAHGGRIWIEDNPAAQGSRVIVTLPVGDNDEQESSVSKDEGSAAHTDSR
jgi:two-component system sensor histidine kinase KdpD